jgi:DNA helicase-2/ATP-dependent DNA helicase PcrA
VADSLNKEQTVAVEIKEGPVLVSAPPGSGKSRIIVHRVANLIESGTDPNKIMVATFTRKAAAELKDRVRNLIGSDSINITCGTFHSICLNLLKNISEKDINIADDLTARNIMSKILAKEGLNVKTKDIMLDISYLKSWMIRPPEAMLKSNTAFEKKMASVYAQYEKYLTQNNILDFDNILLETLKAFNDPKNRSRIKQMFEHVLVDEYQDVNHVQGVLLDTVADRSKSIFAVGDTSQAIYGFLGANLNEFKDFPNRYAGCKPIRLDLNYRSNGNIVKASNSIVKGFMKPVNERDGNKIYLSLESSAEAEANSVRDMAVHLKGTTAILVRAAWQYVPICQALDKSNIRYHILRDTSRVTEEAEEAKNNGVLFILTIHASKGLEFDNVIVVGVEEDIIPYRNTDDIEEERRLFYVAITRARNQVVLSACTCRNSRFSQLSRFIKEIPHNLIKRI